jgi:5-methylcytosine-specific restriction endonuclease McrA
LRRQTQQQRILGSGKWKAVRLRVLARDGYQCAYCGTHLDKTNAQVDHVTPLAKDASDPFNMDGLVAACKKCNSVKGDRVFLAHVLPPLPLSGRSLPETQVTQPLSPFSKGSQA